MSVQTLGGREIIVDGRTQLTVPPAHLSGSRVDAVVESESGRIEIRQGTPGVAVAPPSRLGDKLRAVIRIPKGSSYILEADITEISR